MTQLTNTGQRYGTVAMALHWLMALLLVGLVVLGLYMTSLPDVGFDRKKIELVLWHKELGIAALVLVALRLGWRMRNPLPRLVAGIPDWQKVAARFVHLSFYALMFALPLTGWMMSSATRIPVSFFGLFDLPDFVPYDERLFRTLIEVHKWLGYALIGCFCVHAGAAIRHHWISRDDTLRKMLPGARP
jgi:cytochrome b561